MSVWAVSGAAGYGKTYRLMRRLEEELASTPLQEHQKVLALTFMHGSRRRLEQRLRSIASLKQKYHCVTIDGFARNLRERWQRLAATLGQPGTDDVEFDQQCGLAADMLGRDAVLSWACSAYPLVLVDEAQDLDDERLGIIQALTKRTRVLIAFDDFQCLEESRRPSPAAVWLPSECEPEELAEPKRTNVLELIRAAVALRAGQAPVSGKKFTLHGCESVPQAAAILASQLQWHLRDTVAVITPSRKGKFAEDVVKRVATTPCGKNKHGPFRLFWDEAESSAEELVAGLGLGKTAHVQVVLAALSEHSSSAAVQSLMRWVQKQHEVLGCNEISKESLVKRARRHSAVHKSQGDSIERGFRAMTVHHAKNREFDGVVVLWPHTVRDEPEGKRRLLYNAVTRAKKWCVVVVQESTRLNAPPFAAKS